MPSALAMMNYVPTLIVYSVGIVLSLMTCQRHPKASILALCGFGLLLVSIFVGVGIQIWLAGVARGLPNDEFARVFTIVNAFRAMLLSPIAIGFLMAAIFCRRNDQVQVWEA